MNSLLTSVTNFFNLSKTFAITPAGLVCALALAIVLWPPHPVDTYMQPAKGDYISGSGAAYSRRTAPQFKPISQLTDQLCHFEPTTLPPIETLSPEEYRNVLKNNQEALDRASDRLTQCISSDKQHLAEDDSAVANLNLKIAVDTSDRDKLQAQMQAYANALNPLEETVRAKFAVAQRRVADSQAEVIKDEIKKRNRQVNLDLEGVYQAQIAALLSDPGRLRPRGHFDDIIAGIGNHVIALLSLALLLGYVLDPVNAALFGALFDGGLMGFWNKWRKSRPAVTRVKMSLAQRHKELDALCPPDPEAIYEAQIAAAKKAQQDKLAAENTENARTDCPKLGMRWPAYLLYPEYAIGQKIITQDQLNTLTSQYYSQSQLAFGLFFPTIALWIVSAYRFNLPALLVVSFIATILLAFLIGMDRLHKFNSELQLLIRSSYCLKWQAALAQKATDTKTKVATDKAAAAAKSQTSIDDLSKQIDAVKTLIENWAKSPVNIVNNVNPAAEK